MHPCADILRQIRPDVVVDVGASNGIWSASVAPIWPEAQFILFEPIREYVRMQRHQWRWVSAAAGDCNGTVQLNVGGQLHGSGIYGGPNGREVPLATVDSEVPETGTVFLKLDTHGYEREVLRGAAAVMPRVIGAQIEVYGRRITPTTPLVWELLHEMDRDFGLHPVAWFDQMNREGNSEFWQADVLFLKSDHPIFKANRRLNTPK